MADKYDLHLCIDPGHGGQRGKKQTGTTANDVREASVNLVVCDAFAKALRPHLREVTVTRTEDVAVGLKQRVRIANKARSDLFVSVHVNAVPAWSPYKKTATGCIAYLVKRKKLHEGYWLGTYLCRAMLDRGLVTRFGPQSDYNGCIARWWRHAFYVIRYTDMPAVLFELDFATHPEASKRLRDPAWQSSAGQALARAVIRYCEESRIPTLDEPVA